MQLNAGRRDVYMVMFVLDDTSRLDAVLEAWAAAGVSGVTITESTGIHRRRTARWGIHARHNYEHLGMGEETGNYTLFAIVPDAAVAQSCLAAAERVVGDLNGPNTGVLAVWPLTSVKGVPHP